MNLEHSRAWLASRGYTLAPVQPSRKFMLYQRTIDLCRCGHALAEHATQAAFACEHIIATGNDFYCRCAGYEQRPQSSYGTRIWLGKHGALRVGKCLSQSYSMTERISRENATSPKYLEQESR